MKKCFYFQLNSREISDIIDEQQMEDYNYLE